ncbi:MAG: tyrosine recombinase [candidate division KSB1 bacterium]|nr:tyrosine recombinase [candidate division KSB1 bacterium]
MTFNDCLHSFYNYLRVERNASDNTLAAYKTDIELFLIYLNDSNQGREITVEALQKTMIRGYLSYLYRHDYSKTSAARKLAALRTFCRYLVRQGVLKHNPTLGIATPKLEKRLPDFLTKEEVRHVLQQPDAGTFEGLRDFVILELFYATGLRVSEVAGLEYRNVLCKEGVIRVVGKGRKERLVQTGKELMTHLDYYLDRLVSLYKRALSPKDRLFVDAQLKPLTRFQVAGLVRKYVSRVADDKKAHPHALRHSFATHLLNEGADLMSVKEMLGHENLSTTQIYTHMSADHLKRIYKKYHQRDRESK